MKNQTYEEFYLKYRKISKAYAYGILHDWNMADDVSQDVLYKMYNMRKGLNVDNEKMMYSLIRRSSVNKAMDYKKKAEENMVNLVKEAQESKKKIIMSAMVSVLVIVAAVPLFVVAGRFEMQVWTRVLLMGIGFVIMVIGIAIACVLDREAGAFECPECKERFVPDMKSYVMGPHTITKRKLTCPKCGCTKYCKHVLTR